MFLNATMLAGIAGAMLPLVLHLLNRARYRRVSWGAMMFLDLNEAAPFQSSRVKELVLLLMRMAMVALLAIALSRPVLKPASAAGAEQDRSCIVIVLDRSASMGLEESGPRRFDAARRAALSVLSSLRTGDEAALVFMPEFLPRPPAVTNDLQSMAASLNDVQLAYGRGDVASSLHEAARLLDQSHANIKRIVLVCDRQSASWRDVDGNFAAFWQQRETGTSPHRISVIPIGGNETGNVAIESVQMVNPSIIQNVPAEVEVKVRNFDTVPAVGLSLVITSGDRELYRTTVTLSSGAETLVRTSVVFTAAGSQMLTARLISATGITSDDVLELAVDVPGSVGVLVISGDERSESPGAFRGEADFVRLALAPYQTAGQDGPDVARVNVVGIDKWPDLDRFQHRVVILANVPRISPMQVRRLEQYVYGGGGLLVAPGNLARIDDYNTHLWRDGAGILPAELESPVAADGSQATTLLGLELEHPIFRFLQGRENPLPSVSIGRYFPARAGSEPRARVVGRYASGRAFMVEGSYGRGRVILVTTPLDADWSTLPLSNFYLPLVQSTVRYLAAGMQPRQNLLPGEPIVATLDEPIEPRVRVQGPGQTAPAELLRIDEGYEARFAATARPGNYTMRIGADADERQIHFIVRPPRDESDLSNLPEDRWQEIANSLQFDVLDPDPQALPASLARWRRQRELWPLLLTVVVALAIGEMVLARFWTRGRDE